MVVPCFAKTDAAVEAILSSAEMFFKAMKAKDYQKIWGLLTARSKMTIVDDTYKDIMKSENSARRTKEQISDDFSKGGIIAKAYWDAFLDNFDPDWVLEQSKWDMGRIERNRAEISLLYKKSEKPAMLKMFIEDNAWKTGLVETFWTRK